VLKPSESLVLFDIDGTLMRGAGQHHKEALVEGIRRVTGRSTTLDGVPTSGMLDRDLIAIMLRAHGASARKIQASMRQIAVECQAHYSKICAPDLRPFVCPGVPELLARVRERGSTIGLVTGNLSAIGWKKLELAGLREFFSVGAFAEDGRTRTRLAQVAAWRAKRKGLVTRSARISLIGDHVNDVAAAKANGFQSIAVATGLSSLEELGASNPDVLISNLRELDMERL
jgi:phosphoglycolate phosphatase-like HAD superfamily hydrolase